MQNEQTSTPILVSRMSDLNHQISWTQQLAFGIMETVARIYNEPVKPSLTDKAAEVGVTPAHFVDDFATGIGKMKATNERLESILIRLNTLI